MREQKTLPAVHLQATTIVGEPQLEETLFPA